MATISSAASMEIDALDALAARSKLLRESLNRSQGITESMIQILSSFDHRLTSLDANIRPGQVIKENIKQSSYHVKSGLKSAELNHSVQDKLLVRTDAVRKAHENIDNTLKSAETILAQFDVCRKVESRILEGPGKDLDSYLQAVNQLQANIEFFTQNRSFKSSDGVLNHAQSLLAKAMSKLEEEFRQILTENSKIMDHNRLIESLPNTQRHSGPNVQPGGSRLWNESNGQNSPLVGSKDRSAAEKNGGEIAVPVLLSSHVIPQLHAIARLMISANYHQQCLKAYRDIRASIVEHILQKLGIEKTSKDDLQKLAWESLEGKIGIWIQSVRVAVKLLFAGERKICDQVFHKIDSYNDRCFAAVTVSNANMLLSIGEAVVKSKKSPEKLFVLLDMYETMLDLIPQIQVLFKGNECIGIYQMFTDLLTKLAQTARETFDRFEETVEKDVTKTTVQDGTVHPLTSYVINYVKFLFDYKITLKQLFGEDENTNQASSKLGRTSVQIMSALQSNLDSKAKQYRDPALAQLFLMNNLHYIVRAVQRSEAKDVLGADWLQRLRRIVQQHATAYQRVAWGKVLLCLNTQGLASSGSGGGYSGGSDNGNGILSRPNIKERFKSFNSLVEELHQRQTYWIVPDAELRESLRLAVAEVLLPAYRSFLRRFSGALESGKNPQKYIKYTPEDLERMLGDFFEGKSRK